MKEIGNDSPRLIIILGMMVVLIVVFIGYLNFLREVKEEVKEVIVDEVKDNAGKASEYIIEIYGDSAKVLTEETVDSIKSKVRQIIRDDN